MTAYVVRRVFLILPTLVIATLIVFSISRMVPGSILDLMVSEEGYFSDKDREAILADMGLDVPVHVQYGRWIAGIVTRGDLGDSLWKGMPVADDIWRRLPITFELGIMGIVIGLLIALPVGIYSAVRQDTGTDYIARSFAIFCIAVPGFWLGTLIIIFPSIWWGWSPAIIYIPFAEDPGGNIVQFIVPGALLGMALSGVTMRMTRTMMLEVLRQDYIRTAWAKGLKERVVVMRHALRNALIPIVTIVGFQVPVLVGGSVIMEQIFVLPGIGRLMLDAANTRDYNVIIGITLVLAVVILFNNLVVDLSYAYLDPRVKYR